ncbi:MAG: hypothetical protein LBU34_01055 [Planctomycetaceae bacterium]|nr:hypothetical protein [Planctomycetaceae bacterium]
MLIILSAVLFVFLILHSAFPLIISMIIVRKAKSNISQIILLAATFLYTIWFIYAVYWILIDPDPQALVTTFLMVGFLSLPVMLPLWLISYWLRHYNGSKKL